MERDQGHAVLDAAADERPGATAYFIFGLASLALLMSSIDNTVITVGLPAIARGLRTDQVLAGWTVTAFQVGQLLVMPVAGKLSDELGRKRVFLAGVGLFTVASWACGFSPNIYVLVACRLLQAIGGGTILPSCTGLVADAFPAHRGRAIGMFSSIFPIGGILGPNLGGIVIDHLGWRFIFYVNVPISIAVLALTWWLYRPSHEQHRRQAIDFLGVGIYGAGLAILLIGLSWLGDHPGDATHAPLLYLAVLVACGLFYLWIQHERRTASPMMEMRLLKERPFLAANAYAFFWGAGVFGFVAFLPTYAQLHYHMTATAAGALLTPRSILMIIVSTAASFVLLRFGYRLPMIGGIMLVWLSLILVGLGPESPPSFGIPIPGFAYLALSIAVVGVGFGLSGPASNNAAIDLTPENVAAITGIRAMFRQTGGTIGTAATVFVAALYTDPARGLQVMFVIMSFIMLTIIPWVFLIPDTAKEQWRAQQAAGGRPQPAVVAESELAGD